MSILMHFNDALEFTLDSLSELLKMKKDVSGARMTVPSKTLF